MNDVEGKQGRAKLKEGLRLSLSKSLDRLLERRWFRLGLRTKMTVMVMVGLIGLILIFGALGVAGVRQATQKVLNERVMLAQMSATTLDGVIFHVQDLLTSLARQPALYNAAENPSQTSLDEQQSVLNQISIFGNGVVLLDQEGRVIAHTTSGAEMPLDQVEYVVQHPWDELSAIRDVLAGEEYALAILQAERPYLVMAVPIKDGSGFTSGALATILDLTDPVVFSFIESQILDGTTTLDVIDASGLVLTSSDPQRVLQGRESSAEEWQSALGRLFAEDVPRVGTCLGCETGDLGDENSTIEEVIAFAPLSRAPWGVVVRQLSRDAFASVRVLMWQNLFLGMLTMVGALFLVWITTSSVIRPVQILTEASQRISAGDLRTPISRPHRWWFRTIPEQRNVPPTANAPSTALAEENRRDDRKHNEHNRQFLSQQLLPLAGEDEIDILAESFEAMRQRLERSLDETQALNQELDARVQARTQEALTAQQEAQAAVEALERRNQYLSILNSVALTVNLSLDLNVILDRALEEVLRLTSVDAGAIFGERTGETRNPSPAGSTDQDSQVGEQSSMQLLACRGLSPEAAQLASQLGMLDGSCGGIREKGEIVIVPDFSRYRGVRARSLRRENLSSLVHVPIASKGTILGSMCIATRTQRSYDLEEQQLLLAIASQIGVAIENARLYAEVQHKEQVRGELFRKAITAQEEERNRIARELHDDTSQNLTALIFAAEEIQEMEDKQRIHNRVKSMHDLAQHTLDGVHKLIFDLRPSMLDHLGLVPALRWFAESRLGPKGMRVNIEEHCVYGKSLCRLPSEVETAVFRVVQEAIVNIARHSGARNVGLKFFFEPGKAMILIQDDGIGFEPTEVSVSPENWRGLGLLGMQERLELLGGSLEIRSGLGMGTHISISVPVPSSLSVFEQLQASGRNGNSASLSPSDSEGEVDVGEQEVVQNA